MFSPARALLISTAALVLESASHGRGVDDARVARVSTVHELRAEARAATPGTRIEVAPGDYAGGIYLENLRGAKGLPIVIAGADPKNPPRFVGGADGIHLINPSFVELHDLAVTGAKGNGVSIDDGGKFSPALRGLVLRKLRISNIGPRGNCDALKLSGINGFRVEDCEFSSWGTGAGSGIDMVGCHDGVVTGCEFRHEEDVRASGGSGIQMKGGSARVVVRANRFVHAGERALNIGGSTGLQYFRPPLEEWPQGAGRYEAKEITVEGNTIIGSLSPICFVGIDGATVRFNTIYRPGKWAIRILQETNAPEFVPSRGGVFSDNLIVFSSATWSAGGVNIGGNTAPETFRFAGNHWFCVDRPDRSRPQLPSAEDGGTYGVDPQFADASTLDLRLKGTSQAMGKGATGLRK